MDMLSDVMKVWNDEHSLPIEPSAFLACHHLPCLSTMSSISPFVNEISFGSSGDAVSDSRKLELSHRAWSENTYKCTAPWLFAQMPVQLLLGQKSPHCQPFPLPRPPLMANWARCSYHRLLLSRVLRRHECWEHSLCCLQHLCSCSLRQRLRRRSCFDS